jgi:(p)ppGpp synthase/HD superfamily hydrolase
VETTLPQYGRLVKVPAFVEMQFEYVVRVGQIQAGSLQNIGRSDRRRRIMSTLERAIAIAAEGHSGVKDKGGAPYILHPLRMMLALSSPDDRIAAVLHDVCEDCPGWTLDRLRAEGFPDHIVAALDSVTRREREDMKLFKTSSCESNRQRGQISGFER